MSWLKIQANKLFWGSLLVAGGLAAAACGAPKTHLSAPGSTGLQDAPRPGNAPPGAASPSPAPSSAPPVRLGPPREFSFELLLRRAEALAAEPYRAPALPPTDILERIDYDAHGKLKYRREFALFRDGPGLYPVTFFHLGRYFQVPVRMYQVRGEPHGSVAREVEYEPALFEMPPDSPARELPPGLGFAGLRLQESRLGDPKELPWQNNDWVAFLGATYFRAIGELFQYGISARAIALDVASSQGPEEFPAFRELYVRQDAPEESPIVYALFEGPRVAGAMELTLHRDKSVLMEVRQAFFLRGDVHRLGVAPLTSMYWFSETSHQNAHDWRPEVHDSDGLALWNGGGEHVFRPLNNPPRTVASAFLDENPRGFGLAQRDRVFDHYLDGVRYERRPTLWVEPLGNWGRGAVELIEIPTDDETNDNIVAMWVPEGRALAGARYEFQYRLHWVADEPFVSPLARVVATRTGRGGEPGKVRPLGKEKFVVEFRGGPLTDLAWGVRPEVVVSASRGQITGAFAEAVPDDEPGHFRAQFDVAADGPEPVELRMFLRAAERPLSETWLYQWHPR